MSGRAVLVPPAVADLPAAAGDAAGLVWAFRTVARQRVAMPVKRIRISVFIIIRVLCLLTAIKGTPNQPMRPEKDASKAARLRFLKRCRLGGYEGQREGVNLNI